MTTSKDINRRVRVLWAEYAAYILVTAAMAGLYEWGVLAEGALLGKTQLTFALSTVGVIMMIAFIPLSLKLFPLVLPRVKTRDVARLLTLHHRLSLLRLALLALPTWFNLWLYYATIDNMGGICALMCMVASLFCLPGAQRMSDELLLSDNKK